MSQKTKGIFFIICAGFFFALMSFFVRIAGDLPTMQKAFFRNAVALIIAIGVLVRDREPIVIPRESWLPLFLRATCGSIGLICNFYALDHMNISDANILNKLSPFFAILASTIILKERADLKAWITVGIAFVGALFVVKPSFQMETIYALVAVLGGLTAGIAYTFVRKLSQQGVRGPVIVAFFSAFSCLLVLPFFILQFQPATTMQWLILVAAGIAAAGGQFCITTAYTYAPARDISVYDYTQVIFAALLGFFFLDQVPDVYSMIGYCIIIAAAVIKFL